MRKLYGVASDLDGIGKSLVEAGEYILSPYLFCSSNLDAATSALGYMKLAVERLTTMIKDTEDAITEDADAEAEEGTTEAET